MQRQSFAAILAVGVLAGVAAIEVAQTIDIPGVSKIVRPDRGAGTQCAEGDNSACRKLCRGLSGVSTIRCVERLTKVLPDVTKGGGPSAGAPPGSPPGSGPPAAPPSSPTKPPPDDPGGGPPPPVVPPPSGGPVDDATDLVCHTSILGVRICVRR